MEVMKKEIYWAVAITNFRDFHGMLISLDIHNVSTFEVCILTKMGL